MKQVYEINAKIRKIFKDTYGDIYILVDVKDGMEAAGLFDPYLADEAGNQNLLLPFKLSVSKYGDVMEASLDWVRGSGKSISETIINDDIKVSVSPVTHWFSKHAFKYDIPMTAVKDGYGRVINRKIESLHGRFKLIMHVAIGYRNVTVHPEEPDPEVDEIPDLPDKITEEDIEETDIQK